MVFQLMPQGAQPIGAVMANVRAVSGRRAWLVVGIHVGGLVYRWRRWTILRQA
jgi:hypothetical protein